MQILRQLIREMALKSFTTIPSDDVLGGEKQDLGDEPGRMSGRFYDPGAASPARKRLSKQYLEMTWEQPYYKRRVERQYARTPMPINIFVLPTVLGIGSEESGVFLTRRGEIPSPDRQQRMIELLEKLSPEAAKNIVPGDTTFIVVPSAPASAYDVESEEDFKRPEIESRIKRDWKSSDGAYMVIHALFDNGLLSEYTGPVRDALEELIERLGEAGFSEYVPSMKALVSILRLKTLRDFLGPKNEADEYDTVEELCTVAFLGRVSPVNLGSFPKVNAAGDPIDPAIVEEGNAVIARLSDALLSMLDSAYEKVTGNVIPVSTVPALFFDL